MGLGEFARIIGRAALLRHKAGFLGTEPPYSTHRFFEVCFPDVRIIGAELPRGVTEMVEVRPSRRVLYYSKRVEPPIQREGLLHGAGHLLTDLKRRRGRNEGRAECNLGARFLEQQGALPTDPVEVGCDVFMAEVLAPLDVVDRYFPDNLSVFTPADQDVVDDEVDRLASRFNVTRELIRRRLHDLCLLRRTSFYIPR